MRGHWGCGCMSCPADNHQLTNCATHHRTKTCSQELKKKELDDLEALLGEFGVDTAAAAAAPGDAGGVESKRASPVTGESKEDAGSGAAGAGGGGGEGGKDKKKKKKKSKAGKENAGAEGQQEQEQQPQEEGEVRACVRHWV